MTDPAPDPHSNAGSSALAKASPTPPPAADISSGVFSGIAAFEAAQRMAQALCSSSMVPSDYRGQQGLSNSLIALEIAARMGLSPLVVMQNMTPIHGRPSWSSSFLIATVNASGRFTPLRFVFDDKDNPSSCFAVARDKASGEVLEGQTISIEMAKREGWWSRPDRYGKETSKWQSMTGQMLRYRAAAFWVKVYCPEISLGLVTQEELADVQAVVVDPVEAPAAAPPGPAVPQLLAPLPASSTSAAPLPAQNQPARGSASTAAEVAAPADAPPPRRSSRRAAAATKAETPAAASAPPAAAVERPAEPAAPAAATSGDAGADTPAETGAAAVAQAELPVAAAPAPETDQPQRSEAWISSARKEIPRLNTPDALESARQRVNTLLAAGQLNDGAAEQLWSLIDQRRQQLQAASGEGQP